MKRAVTFVLLLAMELISNSQNLVLNPDLESWQNLTRPSDWPHAENCLKDSLFVLSGKYSCLHTGGVSTASDLGQTIIVSPGIRYKLSFFYTTVTTGSGNGTRIWCYWKDQDGNNISDPLTDAILRPSKYLKSDTWQQFSVSINAPSEAYSFYLEVRTYPNSTAWLDNFNFAEDISTGINEVDWQSVVIYPNPAHELLTVRNAGTLQQIEIHDLTGKSVYLQKCLDEKMVTIPISTLADGLYVIKINTSDKYIIRKFIKKSE